MRKVGIILNNPLNYSEIFIQKEIENLENEGFDLTIFINKPGKSFKKRSTLNVYNLPSESNIKLYKLINIIFNIFLLISYKPFTLINYINLAIRKNGLRRSAYFFYKDSIILRKNVDYLIFAYGFLGLNREILGEVLNKKTIIFFQGSDWLIFPKSNPQIYDQLLKKISLIVVRSYVMKDEINNKISGVSNKINVIRSFIDVTTLNLKSSFSISDKMNLLTVCRLHWIKGLHDIFEAIYFLNLKGVPIQLSVIGEGNEIENERFKYHVFQREINHLVDFKGKKHHEKVLEAMPNFDAVVLPSYSEGIPNFLMEAMVRQLPVITTDWPGFAELINHKKNGIVTARFSPFNLAKGIETFYNMTESERKNLGEYGRQTIINYFHPKDQKAKIKKLFTV